MRTPAKIRDAIRAMNSRGMGIKTIAKHLKISKNTVRNVIKNKDRAGQESEKGVEHLNIVQELYRECKGNAVRIRERLKEAHDIQIGYSTLTKLIRETCLRAPPKRAGKYHFAPGEEMQHDTSPHALEIDGRKLVAQCASLVFTYSRMIFIQYYPAFTRFEAKWFLSEALAFFEGACTRCMVDNTAVVVVKGSGDQAVFAPELEAFGKAYGFEFIAHAVGDANRSAHVERGFHYVENNFLAGRTFRDWADLNTQARAWCVEVANAKPKRSLGMAPQAAFLMEKDHLQSLPVLAPPVYEPHTRTVDNEGFVHLDTNRYSVPERLLGKQVEVFKHPRQVEVFFRGQCVATHKRLIGRRGGKVTAPGHQLPRVHARRREPSAQETTLRGLDPILDGYLDNLKSRVPGRGARAMQRLLIFKRRYPEKPFYEAIAHATKYGLYDLTRLERLILENVAGDFFQLQLQSDKEDEP